MRRHDLDVVSLLAGLVFVTLGGTGLLQAADVIDTGLAWPLIGAIAAVGLTGLVVSIGRLLGSSDAPVLTSAAPATDNAPSAATHDERNGDAIASPSAATGDERDDDGEPEGPTIDGEPETSPWWDDRTDDGTAQREV